MLTHVLYSPDLSAQLCGCWQEGQTRHRCILGSHSVLWRAPQGCLFFFHLPHIQMFCCVFDAESQLCSQYRTRTVQPRPASNSEQSYPSLLSTRIVGMSHCAQLWSRNLSFFCLFVSSPSLGQGLWYSRLASSLIMSQRLSYIGTMAGASKPGSIKLYFIIKKALCVWVFCLQVFLGIVCACSRGG